MHITTSFTASWPLYIKSDYVLANDRPNANIKVTLYPIWYGDLTIEWSVPKGFGECTFNVYFSITEKGVFTKLNKAPLTTTIFTDPDSQEYDKYRKGFYIVEAILVDKGGVALRSLPTTWNPYQNKWVGIRSNEIQRRELLLLRKFVGIKSYLFHRRNYGKRCSLCWDPVAMDVIDDHCPECLGTSFTQGFLPPVELLLQYQPTPNDKQTSYIGVSEENKISAWTVSVPSINPGDIILRSGDWNMYEVDAVGDTELQGNTVRQLVTLDQLSKKCVEYTLMDTYRAALDK